MAQLQLRVQTQDGQAGTATFDVPTKQAGLDLAQQQGLQVLGGQWMPVTPSPLGLRPPMATGAMVPEGTPPGRELPPGAKALAPLFMQLAGGAAFGPPGAIGGGLLGSMIQRGGAPTASDVALSVGPEAMGGVARGVRALRGPRALSEGVSGAAERLGISLPATERFTSPLMNRLRGLVTPSARFGARQLEEVGGAVPGVARASGRLYGNPITAAQGFRGELRTAVKSIPTSRTLVKLVKDQTGIELKAPVTTLLAKVTANPNAVVNAVDLIERETGRAGLMRGAARTWWSSVIDEATKGQHLDPNIVLARYGKLSATGQRLFGQQGGAVNELMAVLGKTEAVKGAGKEVQPLIRLRPFLTALGIGGGAGAALGHTEMGLAGAVAEQVGHAVAPRVLGRLLSSEAGIRWIAAGIDASNRGMPERLLVPALMRGVPRLLQAVSEEGGEEGAAPPAEATPAPPSVSLRPPQGAPFPRYP